LNKKRQLTAVWQIGVWAEFKDSFVSEKLI
jgi:hypothetical protein